MIPTTVSTCTNVAQTMSSAMFGIASLILEGRAVSDDDFVMHDQPYNGMYHFQRLKEKLGQLRQSSPSTSHEILSSRPLSVDANINLNTGLLVSSNRGDIESNIQNRNNLTEEFICEDKPLLSLQSLITTTLCSTPRSVFDTRFWGNSRACDDFSDISHESMVLENTYSLADINSKILTKTAPKQGPHCEQFLKKIGILKNLDCTSDLEEHICDTSVVNEICYHWRIHCLEIDTITSRNDPVCIEVYLGPESDAILLEQWILEYKNKPNNPLMNLPSLCTAIRSQLYFSQITAWSDSIRKSDNNDLYNTGRFKYPNLSAGNNWIPKPRLDIFYRIKPYDHSSTTHFKTKPLIHNFPHVIINDGFGLSISLKSLPRMQNIPAINVNKSSPSCVRNKLFRDKTLNDCRQYRKKCTNNMEKNNCTSTDDENDEIFVVDNQPSCYVTSYREKQVQKYKRLIKKRDSGKRKSDDVYISESKHLQILPEFGSINSIRPPLYKAVPVNISESAQTHRVEMISIGTQTTLNNNLSCFSCGNIMTAVCLKCDNINQDQTQFDNIPYDTKNSLNCNEMNKEELLNTIQKTPKNLKFNFKEHNSIKGSASIKNPLNENDCILCKRQKTQHTYQNKNNKIECNNNVSETVENCSSNNNACDCSITSLLDIKKQILDTEFYPPPEIQFKTPTNNSSSTIIQNLIKSNFNVENSNMIPFNKFLISSKPVPKVNLSQIFCNPSIDFNSAYPAVYIKKTNVNNIDLDVPMQKSNSTPSLPSATSSCLSPSFIKQSVYKLRRARHSSERSDKSSIGSDEQVSDDDLDFMSFGLLNSNGDSSVFKNRPFVKSSRPLLGNLEESLLQKRIVPQKYVSGFKILLGASGAFCTEQVTIPATSYFYELKGQILNTPYVCEIRLPRKGYKIPLKGNIQATLLNPEGTVVRMFVISYDLQDMPPLHQTFVRQRVLTGTDKERNVFNYRLNQSCMKFLRYSIHLRFQTSRSGRLSLHTDVRILISRKTDCDTAAAHAKGDIESPKELTIITVIPENPKYSARHENIHKI